MRNASVRVMMGVFLVSIAALAQVPVDAYQLRYAGNLGAGPSVVNLTNLGNAVLPDDQPNGAAAPNICVNVYVFAEDEQMIACCSCPITPNGLETLSVQKDLISNTLTAGVPLGVTVALLATLDFGTCDAAVNNPPVSGLRAWGTTLHAAPGGGFAVAETGFSRAVLSAQEHNKLTSYCGFIETDGSGYGICGACRAGAAGAARQ